MEKTAKKYIDPQEVDKKTGLKIVQPTENTVPLADRPIKSLNEEETILRLAGCKDKAEKGMLLVHLTSLQDKDTIKVMADASTSAAQRAANKRDEIKKALAATLKDLLNTHKSDWVSIFNQTGFTKDGKRQESENMFVFSDVVESEHNMFQSVAITCTVSNKVALRNLPEDLRKRIVTLRKSEQERKEAEAKYADYLRKRLAVGASEDDVQKEYQLILKAEADDKAKAEAEAKAKAEADDKAK